MAPFITVFTHKNNLSDFWINNITKHHSPPFVDGKTDSPARFKQVYTGMNGVFFTVIDNIVCMYELHLIDDYLLPMLAVTCDSFETVVDFECCKLYFHKIFLNSMDTVTADKFLEIIPRPETLLPDEKVEPVIEYAKEYAYDTIWVPEDDILYAQITKPHTDRPYTVVVRNFTNRGISFIFTSLFACKSWGLCSHDYVFLNHLWKNLNASEPLDLEQKLKEHIKRCEDGEPEPEVYREKASSVYENHKKSRNKKRLLIN